MSHPTETKPSVLLVEDDNAIRRGMQLLLQARGYEVRAYPSAVGLAKDAEALRCDCMVADLVMPQTDAVQLLAELRAAGWTGKSILISGYLEPGWEAKAEADGFAMALPKPISDSVLVRAVSEMVARPPAG